MRGVSLGDLPKVVNNYNNTVADQLTPAGQVLVADGLFTARRSLARKQPAMREQSERRRCWCGLRRGAANDLHRSQQRKSRTWRIPAKWG